MTKTKSPSFVLELELILNPHERKRLKKKLNIGRQIYNACLGEALKLLHKVQNDKEYRVLLDALKTVKAEIAKTEKQKRSKEQKEALKELKQQKDFIMSELKRNELEYGYSEYTLHAWAAQCGSHFDGQVGAPEVQKLATRAFKAVEKLHYHEAERVHFKKNGELISVENKSNKQGLRWKNERVLWGDLCLAVCIRKKDDYAREALKARTKYIRIVPKIIRGKERFYVQFVQEGFPPVKERVVVGPINEVVGIDPGTSTMAIASETAVRLEELAPETGVDEKKLRRIQRAMDRSKRATNPENYHADGRSKKGKHKWTFSNRYKRLAARRKELYRKVAVKRKQSHEILANKIIAIGLDVRVESMQYKGLQKRAKKTTRNQKNGKINKKKRFGKSLGNRAPAMFLTILDQKLKHFGQELKKVNTTALKASQFNHVTGKCTKKELKDRWNLINGKLVQRDLYSAFLIANTNDDLNAINIEQANQWYERFLQLHNMEVERLKQNSSKTLKWFVA